MGRNPAAIRADVALAGEALGRGLETLRRRGWIAPLLVAAGAVVVLVSARRGHPVGEVARTSKTALDTTLAVAAALAAWERYRRQTRAA